PNHVHGNHYDDGLRDSGLDAASNAVYSDQPDYICGRSDDNVGADPDCSCYHQPFPKPCACLHATSPAYIPYIISVPITIHRPFYCTKHDSVRDIVTLHNLCDFHDHSRHDSQYWCFSAKFGIPFDSGIYHGDGDPINQRGNGPARISVGLDSDRYRDDHCELKCACVLDCFTRYGHHRKHSNTH
ncbi:MAG: hypothetical protein Q9159_007734, partial [Coniocarpon cinnabarinum]